MLNEYAGGLQLAYENALQAQDPEVAQAVQSQKFPGEDFLTAAARVLQTYTMADSQRRLLQAQMQRAQQGLPPLNASQYGLGMTFGLSPDTMKLVGLGIGALALLYLVKRRSR